MFRAVRHPRLTPMPSPDTLGLSDPSWPYRRIGTTAHRRRPAWPGTPIRVPCTQANRQVVGGFRIAAGHRWMTGEVRGMRADSRFLSLGHYGTIVIKKRCPDFGLPGQRS
jgi:hypothetical protein